MRCMLTYIVVALVFLLFGAGMGIKLVEGGVSGELALSIVLVILMTLCLLMLVIYLAVRMAIVSALSHNIFPASFTFVSDMAKGIAKDFESGQDSEEFVGSTGITGTSPNSGFDVNSVPGGPPSQE